MEFIFINKFRWNICHQDPVLRDIFSLTSGILYVIHLYEIMETIENYWKHLFVSDQSIDCQWLYPFYENVFIESRAKVGTRNLCSIFVAKMCTAVGFISTPTQTRYVMCSPVINMLGNNFILVRQSNCSLHGWKRNHHWKESRQRLRNTRFLGSFELCLDKKKYHLETPIMRVR